MFLKWSKAEILVLSQTLHDKSQEAEAELPAEVNRGGARSRDQGKSPCLHMHRRFLGVKREEVPPHNKCGHAFTGLCGGIHLSKKLHTPTAEGPSPVRSEKMKQDINDWPKTWKDCPI